MTYGKLQLSPHWGWAIQCEPQVAARIKRVFPRARQEAAKAIFLKATPETSRELAWFMLRYPLDVSSEDRAALERLAAAHVDMEAQLAELLAGRVPIAPFELAKPPRDYQSVAAQAVTVRGGLLLADDLGLGKTVSAVCPMALPENLPAVVVYPSYLPHHWPEKLAEFAPSLRVHTIRTSKPYPLVRQPGKRGAKDLWDTLPDVLLVTYHKLRGWADVLAGIAKYAVYEECQQLRNSNSEIYRAAVLLAQGVQQRMGLTATPIYNYGCEFYWVVNALIPDALGTYEEFVREWCVAMPGGKAALKDSEVFGSYLRREGIMLRRTRQEVGRELPPVTKVVHEVESDTSVLDKLTGDALHLARVIVAQNEQFRGQKMQASGEFDALMRQATGIAKAPYVAEFVRLLLETQQRVLVFGWHRDVYSIWKERLAEFNPVLYTGSESPTQKLASKQAFMSGESRLMFMSLRAGAGLDGLQSVCSTAVFGELDWSPGVHEQCIGRLDRDGQAENVMAFFLVSNEGADPIMADVLGVKREQIEGVRNPGAHLIERRDVGENALRALAAQVLKHKGERVPVPAPVSLLAARSEPDSGGVT